MVFCSQSLAYSFSTQARQCKAVISKVLSESFRIPRNSAGTFSLNHDLTVSMMGQEMYSMNSLLFLVDYTW